MDDLQEVELRNLLKQFGLSSFEQKAYSCFLRNGSGLTAQEICTFSHIPLTRVYGVMKRLVKLRLVSTDKMTNPTRFNLENPLSALRFMLRKYLVKVDDESKKISADLEKILMNLSVPNSVHRGWNIYEEESDVKSLIPSLLASAKKEVLMSDVNYQTFSKDFLEEFMFALERGVTIKVLVSTNPSPGSNVPSALIQALEPAQQAKVAMHYWEKKLFMRKNGRGLAQFAIFDGLQVAYAVTSPRTAKYFATLLVETKETINEFFEDFHDAWEKASELRHPTFQSIPK